MRVQHEPGPVGRRNRAGDEVGDGDRVLGDERLLLRGECELELGVARAVHADREPPLVDPRPYVDGNIERRRAELGEPEAELLDEVECEPVAAGRTGRVKRELELDLVARLDDVGERRPAPVPDDRIAEWIEPVIGELHALAPA